MLDIITGEKFITVAEMTYSLNFPHDLNKIPSTFGYCKLKDHNIVYTHTMYIKPLFEALKSHTCLFTVLSHNCDVNVTRDIVIPPNVRKWFTTNVNASDERLESLPIGLENKRWFPQVKKKEQMMLKLQEPRTYRNLVYMNFNIQTNPSERLPVFDHFRYRSWTTTQLFNNGQMFDNYIDQIYNHKFVVCPEGNGMDTHRTWETLYMGSIPIEKRNLNNRFYTDLPICFVDDWKECTEEFLNREFVRIKGQVWDYDKLNFHYWKNRINEGI